jgi:hypothetical protein
MMVKRIRRVGEYNDQRVAIGIGPERQSGANDVVLVCPGASSDTASQDAWGSKHVLVTGVLSPLGAM